MGLKPATNPDTETASIELTIDGKHVAAKDGVSLYDVISSTGKIVPAMCYHYTFDPFGSCGMCLVMQEGKKAPVRSCTAKAAAGMLIRTEGDDLFQARKKAVEKHLSVHPLDCPVCDADGHCELQDMAFQHGVTNLANAKQKFIPEDTRSLVLDFNMNRCIACAECINVCKDVLMIDALQFMKKGGFNQVVAKGDAPLSCEFCGDCLAVCPVGAITNKYSKYLYKPWQMKKTTTTCNYCGDGCQMYLETKDTEVVRVTSPLSWKNKWGDRADTTKGHGGICVRGRFGFQYIDSKARLRQPLVRKDSQLVETPWLETMETLVDRLSDIHRKHGPESIAGLITARCTNEELYLFQKLMRTGFRTNQLDSSARYGHLNFVHAVHHALNIGRSPNDWEDLTKAKAILLIGSNLTETNPLTSVRVKEAIRVYKSQVIVIDSAMTNMAQLASHPLIIKPGTEGVLIDGLVKSVIEQDLIDEEATARHPAAFAALKQAMAHITLERIAAQTGISVDLIHEAAAMFAEAPRSIALCAEGIVRRPNGYHNVLKLIDLAWVTGKLGRAGCGVNTVTEEINEQGAVDMGVAPEFLPGQARFDDPTARQRWEQAWDVTLPAATSGANLMEILERCRHGQIKALYVVGENPLATLPASAGVKAALEKLSLLIVQDPFPHRNCSTRSLCTSGFHLCREGRDLHKLGRPSLTRTPGAGPDRRESAGLAYHDRIGEWTWPSMAVRVCAGYSERNHEALAGVLQPGTTTTTDPQSRCLSFKRLRIERGGSIWRGPEICQRCDTAVYADHGTSSLSLGQDVDTRLRFGPDPAELGPAEHEPKGHRASGAERNLTCHGQFRNRIRAIANQTRSQCDARDLFLPRAFY